MSNARTIQQLTKLTQFSYINKDPNIKTDAKICVFGQGKFEYDSQPHAPLRETANEEKSAFWWGSLCAIHAWKTCVLLRFFHDMRLIVSNNTASEQNLANWIEVNESVSTDKLNGQRGRITTTPTTKHRRPKYQQFASTTWKVKYT